jgi:hypothetical protein
MSVSPCLDIPYRLESLEDVLTARRVDLLGLGASYEVLLRVARHTRFIKPPALRRAQREVRKEFYRIKEETVRESRVRYEEIVNLAPIRDVHRMEASLPWAKEVAGYSDFGALLHDFPARVRESCLVGPPPRSPMTLYESALAIRRVIRQELLAHVKTGRTNLLSCDQLRRLMVGYCLFTAQNEDVRQGLRPADGREVAGALYQHALAELLFCRLPEALALFLTGEPAAIRQKLFAKIGKLDLTGRQRANLYGYFPPHVPQAELLPTLEKIESVMRRMQLAETIRQRHHHYLLALRRSLTRAPALYQELFLPNPELQQMRALHVPGRVLKTSVTYAERILRTRTKQEELHFYPTKDYLDLCRGQFSGDCVGGGLSEQQLATPNFFNVRVFSAGHWIGNIYLLDFTEEQDVLLVDRIQIRREMKVPYLEVFERLTHALRELFEAVPYTHLLAPLSISNHATIQAAFHTYRKKLPTRRVDLPSTHVRWFEGLQAGSSYHVLCQKEARDVPSGEN